MLKGEKVILRMIREKDLDILYTLLCDSIEIKGDYYPIEIKSETDFKSFFRNTGFWDEKYGQMVMINKNDEIIGHICYYKTSLHRDSLEIGSVIYNTEDRVKGIGSEAIKLFVNFLFNTKKINRLQVAIMPDNIPAIKTVEKLGFVFEGTLRKSVYIKGKYHDINLFSLLKDEYFNKKL